MRPFNYHVPSGFVVGAEPVRRPGLRRTGGGGGGVMREIGALALGDGWYKEVCAFENLVGGKKTFC